VPHYRRTLLFVRTDVSTAITNTAVLYIVYYKNLTLILLDGEGKVTLEQVMMTYTENREIVYMF